MKKIITIFVLFSLLSFSQTTDSLSYYKEKANLCEQKLKADSSEALQKKFEEREAELKAELEGQEAFYKARIDKLQTLLIGAIVSSVMVIAFSFYMLNKKKQAAKN